MCCVCFVCVCVCVCGWVRVCVCACVYVCARAHACMGRIRVLHTLDFCGIVARQDHSNLGTLHTSRVSTSTAGRAHIYLMQFARDTYVATYAYKHAGRVYTYVDDSALHVPSCRRSPARVNVQSPNPLRGSIPSDFSHTIRGYSGRPYNCMSKPPSRRFACIHLTEGPYFRSYL